jgi:hypothetical protein
MHVEISDILIYALVFILGTVWGWNLRERHAERKVDSFMEEIDSEVKRRMSDQMITINIEKQNGVFYVYNKDSNDFMGQGKTKQELEENLAKRFPDKKFVADTNNLKDMGF